MTGTAASLSSGTLGASGPTGASGGSASTAQVASTGALSGVSAGPVTGTQTGASTGASATSGTGSGAAQLASAASATAGANIATGLSSSGTAGATGSAGTTAGTSHGSGELFSGPVRVALSRGTCATTQNVLQSSELSNGNGCLRVDVPAVTGQPSLSVTCASATRDSSWTVFVFSDSECGSPQPTAAVHGQGVAACQAVSAVAVGVLVTVDCSNGALSGSDTGTGATAAALASGGSGAVTGRVVTATASAGTAATGGATSGATAGASAAGTGTALTATAALATATAPVTATVGGFNYDGPVRVSVYDKPGCLPAVLAQTEPVQGGRGCMALRAASLPVQPSVQVRCESGAAASRWQLDVFMSGQCLGSRVALIAGQGQQCVALLPGLDVSVDVDCSYQPVRLTGSASASATGVSASGSGTGAAPVTCCAQRVQGKLNVDFPLSVTAFSNRFLL